MATAAEAQALLQEAQCFECYGANSYSLQLMKLSLLRQILLASDPMADASPDALLAAASCYQCYAANPYALQLMELALLSQISAAGGGGGAALDVLGNPEGVLTADHNQFAWDEVNDVLWVHEGADGTNTGWVQIV